MINKVRVAPKNGKFEKNKVYNSQTKDDFTAWI